MRLWSGPTAMPCVNYTCKTYYIQGGHLLAGEMRPASTPASQSQTNAPSAGEMIVCSDYIFIESQDWMVALNIQIIPQGAVAGWN